YDSTPSKFNDTPSKSRLGLGSFFINGESIHLPERKSHHHQMGVGLKGHHLCLFCKCPMLVMGVNNEIYDNTFKTVSNISSSPLLGTPTIKGLMTTVHVITATQNTMHSPCGKLWCDGRNHSCFYWHHQGYSQGHPLVEGKADWVAFCTPPPICGEVGITGIPQGDPELSEYEAVSCDCNSDPQSSTFEAGAGIAHNVSSFPSMIMNLAIVKYSKREVDHMIHMVSKE
ncbi:Glyceraldehyde-3-phosphate dehydrogenase, partial [Galemys pyrenaicus]